MRILAQILENLTNFYFGSDFANCTNFMWSKTSLEEGPISQKLQKFKHHDFIFIYTAHQNTKNAKIQASRFHFQGEYPPA